jgi:HEAT repeat protein
MPGHDFAPSLDAAISGLEEAYTNYGRALDHVVRHREAAVPALIAALGDRKTAGAAASALGHLMHLPESEPAIPPLLAWLGGQNAVYHEALKALVRAGERVLPHLLSSLRDAVGREDDETIRNLFDLGTRLPDGAIEQLVPSILTLLSHQNPHIRVAAADAIWRLGQPHGRAAVATLRQLAKEDAEEDVRESATEALIRLGAS